MIQKDVLLQVFHKEIEKAIGCTEIGCVALAASRAAEELGKTPDTIEVTVSTNIFKNAANVGVPGTNLKGINIAIALGLFTRNSKAGLAILDFVSEEGVEKAKEFVRENRVTVIYKNSVDPVYVKAIVSGGNESASVVIEHDHSNIVEISKNNQILFKTDQKTKSSEETEFLRQYRVEELINYILEVDPKEFSFLLNAALVNYEAAQSSLQNPGMCFGPALAGRPQAIPQPFSAINQVQTLTAAASEARMAGIKIPIMAITGSGNHGITNFLGMYAFAMDLHVSTEQTIKALAISTLITVYIKEFTTKLTAYCGCAVAPATGIAAGCVYLLGGNYLDMTHAMQSVIGTFSGLLCDGAKESCAYKVSTVAGSAIQFAYLALQGAYIPAGNGILGNTIEETFENLAFLNNPGMKSTDEAVVHLIEKNLHLN